MTALSPFTMTLAQEAAEYIELGSGRIGSDTPERVLIYLARKYVEKLERDRRRDAARKTERAVAVTRRTSAEVETDIARVACRKAWQAVLGTSFAVSDGVDVTWGAATRADHLARANAQRKHASAAEADARLHELALRDLATWGVKSLGEL